MMKDFGPLASSFKLQSGEMSYVWQLEAAARVSGDRYTATARTRYCKVSVIADPKGIVTDLRAEDTNTIDGSICAQRLGIQRQT